MADFPLTLRCAAGMLFTGRCTALTLPTAVGRCGILPHHADALFVLAPGEAVLVQGARRTRVALSGGIARVEGGKVLLLATEAAILPGPDGG